MIWTPTSVALIAVAALALVLLLVIGARISGLQGRLAALGLVLLLVRGAGSGGRQGGRAAGGRIEANPALLLKQPNIRYAPFTTVTADVADAVRSNRKIEAIKLYRRATGVGLKEAKDY